ncbi:hypothetical protein [Shimia sagamensis]|uniref:Uncharacterized protein n=1 Tax=Shimia sagamensis TaxID=1566352 RepID=A0ABY1NEP8_9RHOB|nr:hypothetical protein SAMN06265373_101786 [Shimia sagamensis]
MNLIADILLVAGALGAGIYCFVLARRLSKFNDLESGVGGAVAVLSAQVDDMTRTLKAAQVTAGKSTERLEALTQRAEGVSKRLELMMAAMHDIEDAKPAKAKAASEAETAAPEAAKEEAAVAEAVSDEVEIGTSVETADDEDWARIQAEALAAEEAKLIRRAKKKAKKKAQKKAAMALAAMQAEATPTAPQPSAKAKEPEAGPIFKRHVA